ncbi:MAG TPA: 2-enoyl thioester reductase domain-containing protein [Chthoniobacteraceae bacterium]|nr:2-enoyl thioester reductase domain-containing protein [Chthoniobacteraceae bacterium]
MIQRHGPPAEAARVEPVALPDPQPHEALVRMLAAPINPADLNLIEGKYGIRPELPAVMGIEGAGRVEEIGSAVTNLKPGALVLMPTRAGAWREASVVAANDLIAVPEGIAPEQAAMLRVNPATAWRMLHDFVPLARGDCVVQNAANSAVGRAVNDIGRELGFRILNVARRDDAVEEFRGSGSEAFLDNDDLGAALERATNGAPIRLALNAVGGDSALRLAKALATGGTIVTYGAMSRQPLRIPAGLLIFSDVRWRGFWVTRWFEAATAGERAAMFGEIFSLARRGVIGAKIERVYPITAVSEALTHAAQGGRSGKILFGFDHSVLEKFPR